MRASPVADPSRMTPCMEVRAPSTARGDDAARSQRPWPVWRLDGRPLGGGDATVMGARVYPLRGEPSHQQQGPPHCPGHGRRRRPAPWGDRLATTIRGSTGPVRLSTSVPAGPVRDPVDGGADAEARSSSASRASTATSRRWMCSADRSEEVSMPIDSTGASMGAAAHAVPPRSPTIQIQPEGSRRPPAWLALRTVTTLAARPTPATKVAVATGLLRPAPSDAVVAGRAPARVRSPIGKSPAPRKASTAAAWQGGPQP